LIKQLPDKELLGIYSDLSESRKQFVKSHIATDEEYIEKWLSVKYTGKDFFEGCPTYMTERGEQVRSKSEKILADKLYSLQIPYRYEYPLKLKRFGTVYPDFTLLKISTKEEIYLEHFGMMDDSEYSKKAVAKLQEYAKNNIYPGKNLLVTYETLSTSLDMNSVENMLKEFILS